MLDIFKGKEMTESQSSWSEKDYINLLRDGIKPDGWKKESFKIFYDFLHNLFESCYAVTGDMECLISNALLLLDNSLLLPSKIYNLKRKVNNYVTNKKKG